MPSSRTSGGAMRISVVVDDETRAGVDSAEANISRLNKSSKGLSETQAVTTGTTGKQTSGLVSYSTAHKNAAKEVEKHSKVTDLLGKSLKGAAAAGGGFVAAYAGYEGIKEAVEFTEELAHQTQILSNVTGLDAKAASQWIELGKQRGLTSQQIGMSMTTLSKQIRSAATGSSTAEKNFHALGIPLKELEKLSTQQVLLKISDAFSEMNDGSKKAALNQTFFGKSAKALLPVLDQGSKAVKGQLNQFSGLSESQQKQAEGAIEMQRKVSRVYDQLRIDVTFALLSASKSVEHWIQDIIKGKGDVAKTIHDIGNIVGPTLKNYLDAAETYFKGLGQVIKGVCEVIQAVLHGELGKAWKGVEQIFQGGAKLVEGLLQGMEAPIKGILSGLGTSMSSVFSGIWGGIKDIWRTGANDVIGFLNTMIGAIDDIPGVPNIGKITPIGETAAKVPSHAALHHGKTGDGVPGKAIGGPLRVPGSGNRDTVPITHADIAAMVAPGEDLFVANKHQRPMLDKAVAQTYGVNGLSGFYNTFNRPHYAAGGGQVPGFLNGGDVLSALGSAGSAVAGTAKGVFNTAAGAIGSLPTPHLPHFLGDLGSYVVSNVADYIKGGFQSKKFGNLTSSLGSVATGPVQQMAHQMVLSEWGASEWPPFVDIEMSEAGWNPHAQNPHSTAYGLAQNINPATYPAAGRPGSKAPIAAQEKAQLSWMVKYIKGRYGTPTAAWAFHQANNSYASGGQVKLHGPPLFHGEGPPFYDAAYQHNRPFATNQAPWSTSLNKQQEAAFRKWGKNIGGHPLSWYGFDPDSKRNDYDMRGFFLSNGVQGGNGHFTDTFKTPYDTTFSNLSKYARTGTPFVWNKSYSYLYDRRNGQEISSGKYASGGQVGTAGRAVQWAHNNIGAGVGKQDKWDAAAGFGPGTEWCGIFLGADMKAQGITPPSGYASASAWGGWGTSVSNADMQPGDILDYGSTHVAMYIGNGQQIQGNDSDGTVGVSGIGSGLGLGPITAIRRPPYTGASGTTTKSGSKAKPHYETGLAKHPYAVSLPGLKPGKVTGAAKGLPASIQAMLKQPGLTFANKLSIGELAGSLASGTESTADDIAAAKYNKGLEEANLKREEKALHQIEKELKKKGLTQKERTKLLGQQGALVSGVASTREGIQGFNETINAKPEATEETESQTKLLEEINQHLQEQNEALKAHDEDLERNFAVLQSQSGPEGTIAKAISALISGQIGGKVGLGFQTPTVAGQLSRL